MGLAPRAKSTLRKTVSRTSTRSLDREHERAGDPCPLRPPGHRHALPDLRPSHYTRLPGRPPRQITGSAGRVYGNARSTQRRASSQNTRPARPVRGCPWKADGAHRPLRWPVGLGNTIRGVCGQLRGDVILVGEPAKNLLPADAMLGEVYQLRWLAVGVSRGELAEGTVRPGRVVVSQAFRAAGLSFPWRHLKGARKGRSDWKPLAHHTDRKSVV